MNCNNVGSGESQTRAMFDAEDVASRRFSKNSHQSTREGAQDLSLPAERVDDRAAQSSLGSKIRYILMAKGFMYLTSQNGQVLSAGVVVTGFEFAGDRRLS